MKKILFIFLMVPYLLFTSCEKLYDWNQPKEQDVEYSAVWPLAGEWYVLYGVKDPVSGEVTFDEGFGYFPLFTYNTADNKPENMWINDDGNFWDFRVKAAASPKTKSFGSDVELDNASYASKVKVTNGLVILNGATTSGGNVSDSIYFEVAFDDDNTPYENTYVLAGYRRTGFEEDEH